MRVMTLMLAVLFGQPAPGQFINSIWHTPANPTTADPIRFYVDLTFSYGTCDQHSQSHFINGNVVDAYALHCIGILTVICSHTDTFNVSPLPAGNYVFRFHVDAGGLPFPCTPGFVTGPTDSISFTVSPVTGLQSAGAGRDPIQAYVDPVDRVLKIKSHIAGDFDAEIYSIHGVLLSRHRLSGPDDGIDISTLIAGIYVLKVAGEGFETATFRFPVLR